MGVAVLVEVVVLVKVVGIGIVDNPIRLDSIFALSVCSDIDAISIYSIPGVTFHLFALSGMFILV